MTLGDGGISFDSGGTTSSSSSYTDENAMDAVGNALRSTSTVVAVYNDASDTISFSAIGYPTDTITVPKVTVLTATTTSVFTVTTGTQRIIVEVVGAGGGGGGCPGSSTQAGTGGSGGGGGYTRKFITSTATAYTYRVGPKGTGGAAGANAGTDGSTSVFATLSSTGGSGGAAGSVGTSALVALSGAGGTGTGGDINSDGGHGQYRVRLDATNAISGDGGSSVLGAGAQSPANNTAGNNATTLGSGGSGARVASQNTARAGGDGADGTIIVQEFVRE